MSVTYWHDGAWRTKACVKERVRRAHVTFRVEDEMKVRDAFKEALPEGFKDTLQIMEDSTGATFWCAERMIGTLSHIGDGRIGIQ